jgi:transcription elongation factor GreA
VNETWLTAESFAKLKADLDYLSGPLREEIKERIAAAREEGDLKENGGYHAAREEQGKNEARIKQLAKMLENAKVGEPEIEEGVVSQGMVVKVEFTDFGDEETFLLGSREQNDHIADLDVYSATSPLGAAVLGQEVGTAVSFETPNGKTMNVRIISAELYRG